MPTVGSPWNSRRPSVGLRFVSWLAVLLLLPLAASGQQPLARSQLQLPFDPGADPQLFLKSLLAKAKDREAFERLWHDWQRNQDWGEKFQAPWNDPQLRERIEKMLHKEGERLKKLDPQQVEALRKKWERLKLPEGPKLGPDEGPKPASGPLAGSDPDQQAPSPPEPAAEEDEGQLTEWLHDWLQELEETGIGQVLRESPAFQQGLADLQEAILHGRSSGPSLHFWDVPKLVEGLPLPGWNLPELRSGVAKLPTVHLPSLPRPRLPFGGPMMPGVPSGSASTRQVILLLLLLAAGGFLLWRAVGRLRTVPPAARGWRLGPWPIDPAHITTRAELVRAFEHLSLLLLGPAARTRNHLAVAAALVGTGPDAARRQNAAAELADLYEQARYAPEEGPLTPEQLAAARRDLCLLAASIPSPPCGGEAGRGEMASFPPRPSPSKREGDNILLAGVPQR
jgi:hypothetical protein